MNKTILTILILITSIALAQEHKSIHQIEWEQHWSIDKEQQILVDVTPPNLIQLQINKQKSSNASIFGFLPDWEYPTPEGYLDFDLLTHIAAFDFVVNNAGEVGNPANWPWTDLINSAHSKGVKIVMTAVCFDSDDIHTILTNSTIKDIFFENVKNKINTYMLDGVNIDFEGVNTDDRGSVMNNFMQDLTDYLHIEIPGTEVSFAGPAVNWGGWNFPGLTDACDYIFIMGYDFYGSWSSTSGPCAPLTGGSYNVTNTLENQYAGVNPDKLILGVPYYGSRWETAGSGAYSNVIAYINHPRYNNAAQEVEEHGLLWDNSSQTPWYYYQSSGKHYQVWFDNDSSLGLKYDLAQTKNLKGVGMWALGYDSGRNELWDELAKHFADTGYIPLPDKPQAVLVKQSAQSDAVYITFNGDQNSTGYWIYYGTDGLVFNDSVFFGNNEGLVTGLQTNNLYYFKISGVNSRGLGASSQVFAAAASDTLAGILIIDGFERTSGTNNTFNYIRQHTSTFNALGYNIASADNNAVTAGVVDLNEFEIVDWFLGDESTTDITFSVNEQAVIKTYLENGRKLLVSGSEIGWDLVEKGTSSDKSFYENYLKSEYVSDAPNDKPSEYYTVHAVASTIFEGLSPFNFDDGTHGTFDVDWPDAVKGKNGGTLGLLYSGVSSDKGGAGIYYSGTFGSSLKKGKLVHLSVPFETVYPDSSREALLSKIMDFFNSPVSIDEWVISLPEKSELYQNYPNPFNASTTIKFYLAKVGQVSLKIYNMLGQEVHSMNKGRLSAGSHKVVFNAANLSSGLYVYEVITQGKCLRKKMMLIK